MGFVYAFSRTGRHIRKIASEARSFVGTRFRNIKPSLLRDTIFAQYFAIDNVLFQAYYSEADDPLYWMHVKYKDLLIKTTACDFLGLCRVFSCGIAILQFRVKTTLSNEQLNAHIAEYLSVVEYIHGGRDPRESWESLIGELDDSVICAKMNQAIAGVLRFNPTDKFSFGGDWLSLVPYINRAAKSLTDQAEWRQITAAMMHGRDFGG